MLGAVRDHFETLGKAFDKEDVARAGIDKLGDQVSALNPEIANFTDKALILLHNNGAFSSFGQQSRYRFVFNELGVNPAGAVGETGLHGQPVTSEFI
ncbi:ABC transporter substrate-binding protein [Pseudodonghicola flavimaris]|uniref:ABC transporter substrate-binding protein n=1 Tax=Pseudodonghicola flavimaris TaxID=3050036 RepID=UPI00389A16BE